MNGLPPLTEDERITVRAEFAAWHAEHAGSDYNYTDGEATWEWAYWNYKQNR